MVVNTHLPVDFHVGVLHMAPGGVPPPHVPAGKQLLICTTRAATSLIRLPTNPLLVFHGSLEDPGNEHWSTDQLTALLLLLEEGTVEGSGDGVDHELEAVVDIHLLHVLHPDQAPKNPRWLRRRCPGRGLVPAARILVHDAGVVGEDVRNDGRVDPEREAAVASGGRNGRCGRERVGGSRGRVGDVRRRHRRSGA